MVLESKTLKAFDVGEFTSAKLMSERELAEQRNRSKGNREGWGGCIECVEANLIIKGQCLSVGGNTVQTLSVGPYLS